MKRIKSITVKSPEGETVAFYAPNFIGSTEQKLVEFAEKLAAQIGGKIIIRR
jgi:hypothetical protein